MYALLTVAPLLSSLLLNAPSPSSLVSRKMLLYCKAEAAVSAVLNPQGLDYLYGLDYTDDNGEHSPANTDVTASGTEGTKHKEGVTQCYLINNTGSTVTIGYPLPYTTIAIDVLVSLSRQSAIAKINRGGVTVPDQNYPTMTTPDLPDPTYDSRNVYFNTGSVPASGYVQAGDGNRGTFYITAISPP